MTDRHYSTATNQIDHATLPTPRFDADATASAQPVEPIGANRLSKIRIGVRSVNGRIDGRSRMLPVVVLIGLITGAVAGLFLVNIAHTAPPATVAEVPASEPEPQIPVNEMQKLDIFATALGAREAQAVPSIVTRNRRPKVRFRINRPRAYRVAVIR